MNCSDVPSAWELWVCNPARKQGWVRYGVYETHAHAKAFLGRVEGSTLELKIVPLYPAIIEETLTASAVSRTCPHCGAHMG